MNQEAEEQRPIPQTFCGALQKEANCKCLVLSVLIYGCLAAVTWCRCANVTKVVIDFLKYPITSTKHVSPCDDGYVYIPVAFMGMLYLVYLVECYHSPIRIDLLHARSQDSVLAKLAHLKMAQATIWWKAISYHYVRRKRQITRYRNGDNYTTTQVYYERVNTHAATSFYFYGYCGVKDISKELVLDPKLPITKISLTKGFAFSNMRSATEFEEARSRFFAEQEHRDDYMEMREGLDLGYNFNPTSLVAVLGKPWFTNAYVYWSLSALLLSWPLRIIIECNTQYTDYQVTKLFGVNYDAPTGNGQPIHASSSQLSAPGSYMLVPSYSEALLMEPGPVPPRGAAEPTDREQDAEMVPSYSEALLYERAYELQGEVTVERCPEPAGSSSGCECPCHSEIAAAMQSLLEDGGEQRSDRRSCASCATDEAEAPGTPVRETVGRTSRGDRAAIPRDTSEPNLRTSAGLKKLPSSRTYLCIRSILKQHRRRYTLVTAEELQHLVGAERRGSTAGESRARSPHCCGAHWERIDVNSNTVADPASPGSQEGLGPGSASLRKGAGSRALIFASPIQEVCPSDPFGGRTLVPSENPPDYEDALDLPVLSRLKRSFTERETRESRPGGTAARKHHRTFSIEPEYLFSSGGRQAGRRCQADGTTCDVVIPVQNGRVVALPAVPGPCRRAFSEDRPPRGPSSRPRELSRLHRSLTERTPSPSSSSSRGSADRRLRRSFAGRIEFPTASGGGKTNINMETSL